ncbi:MAG: DUF1302 family protein [bacterium]
MKRYLFLIAIILFFVRPALADSPISGSILVDTRVQTSNGSLSREEYRLTVKAAKRIHELYAYGEVWLRGFGITQPTTYLPSLQQYSSNPPTYLDVRQVYVEFYSFLLKDLDVKIGKQILNWGTADELNVTNNVNPYDLEDPFAFNNKLPVPLLVAEYYFPHEISLTGVVEPLFVPTVLPSDKWINAFITSQPIPPWLPINQININVSEPQQSMPGNLSYGFRIAKKALLGYDISLSYYDGFYTMPVLTGANITAVSGSIIANADLSFPRLSIIGGDFAGSIGDHGVWGEVALNIPHGPIRFNSYVLNTPYAPASYNIAVSPFVKYVLGTDYTFNDGTYMNLQFLHGEFYEIGNQLQNYIALMANRNFLYDTMQAQISIVFELAQHNLTGFMYYPELDWMPYDNVKIAIGGFWFTGDNNTVFGNVTQNSEVFLKASYVF